MPLKSVKKGSSNGNKSSGGNSNGSKTSKEIPSLIREVDGIQMQVSKANSTYSIMIGDKDIIIRCVNLRSTKDNSRQFLSFPSFKTNDGEYVDYCYLTGALLDAATEMAIELSEGE